LREFCNESNKPLKSFSKEALRLLTKYSWTGNIRELKNVVENIVVFSKNDLIEVNELPENIIQGDKNLFASSQHSLNINENEKFLIQEALKDCHYNKTKAALKLGMSRRTIHRKIKEYGLNNE